MKNKEKNYDLNLDSLVPFFLIGDEEIKNRVWFKANKEEEEEDNSRIFPCGISPNWQTTRLLMDEDEKKYWEYEKGLYSFNPN